MSTVQETKPKRAPSPEALERQKIKEQKASHVAAIKSLDEQLARLAPKKKVKGKVVLTPTMTLAKNVSKALTETRKTKDGKIVPKMVASRTEFKKACNTITGLNNVETELKRFQVEGVVREGLAVLEKMPKPEPKPRVKKGEGKPESK